MVEPGSERKQDIFVSRSDVHLEHSWSAVDLAYSGQSFFELRASEHWTTDITIDGSYSSVYFRAGSKHQSYGSNPYKILDLLSDLGGLLFFISTLGISLTAFCVRRSLEKDLLKDTFQV